MRSGIKSEETPVTIIFGVGNWTNGEAHSDVRFDRFYCYVTMRCVIRESSLLIYMCASPLVQLPPSNIILTGVSSDFIPDLTDGSPHPSCLGGSHGRESHG